MSRFDAAPLIAFIAAKETDYGNETDGRIPPRCGAYCADQWADTQAGSIGFGRWPIDITANPDRGTTDQAVFWARVRKTAIIQSTDFGSQYYKALIGLRDNSSGRSPTLTR